MEGILETILYLNWREWTVVLAGTLLSIALGIIFGMRASGGNNKKLLRSTMEHIFYSSGVICIVSILCIIIAGATSKPFGLYVFIAANIFAAMLYIIDTLYFAKNNKNPGNVVRGLLIMALIGFIISFYFGYSTYAASLIPEQPSERKLVISGKVLYENGSLAEGVEIKPKIDGSLVDGNVTDKNGIYRLILPHYYVTGMYCDIDNINPSGDEYNMQLSINIRCEYKKHGIALTATKNNHIAELKDVDISSENMQMTDLTLIKDPVSIKLLPSDNNLLRAKAILSTNGHDIAKSTTRLSQDPNLTIKLFPGNCSRDWIITNNSGMIYSAINISGENNECMLYEAELETEKSGKVSLGILEASSEAEKYEMPTLLDSQKTVEFNVVKKDTNRSVSKNTYYTQAPPHEMMLYTNTTEVKVGDSFAVLLFAYPKGQQIHNINARPEYDESKIKLERVIPGNCPQDTATFNKGIFSSQISRNTTMYKCTIFEAEFTALTQGKTTIKTITDVILSNSSISRTSSEMLKFVLSVKI